MAKWYEITDNELQEIWDAQRTLGICFNGCTQHWLARMYGDKFCHRPGVGWFRSVARRPIPKPDELGGGA